MSLINEALKKAQRARQEGAPNAAETEPGGAVVRRAKPRSARSMLLMGVAAVVLIVGSMIGTAIWVTRAPDAPAATAKPPATSEATAAAATPPVPSQSVPAEAADVAPIAVGFTLPAAPSGEKPPAAEPTPPSIEPAAESTIAATPMPAAAAPVDVAAKTGSAVTGEAAPPPVPEPAPEPVPDERVHKFVESVRVMGIRSSGSESKVLMNDRVYRVNDVVDRTLGVKLTKVAPDSLTFTDANGAVYVKNF